MLSGRRNARMSATLMACPEDSKQTGFLPVGGENFMLRHNSSLPIVIYAKDGFKIRYTIWKLSDDGLTSRTRLSMVGWTQFEQNYPGNGEQL